MTDKNLALTDEELATLESQAQGDVLRLVAEVRGLRVENKRLHIELDATYQHLDAIIVAHLQPGIRALTQKVNIAKKWRGVKDG